MVSIAYRYVSCIYMCLCVFVCARYALLFTALRAPLYVTFVNYYDNYHTLFPCIIRKILSQLWLA